MLTVQLAASSHVKGIKRVCIDANRTTYKDLCKEGYIEKVIREFYNEERIHKEVSTTTKDWGGYFVALDSDRVVGAAGGGMISDNEAELYVLYLDPDRRNEGIGSKLLEAVTKQQKSLGAIEQWVSVLKGNQKEFLSMKQEAFTSNTKSHPLATVKKIIIAHFDINATLREYELFGTRYTKVPLVYLVPKKS